MSVFESVKFLSCCERGMKLREMLGEREDLASQAEGEGWAPGKEDRNLWKVEGRKEQELLPPDQRALPEPG